MYRLKQRLNGRNLAPNFAMDKGMKGGLAPLGGGGGGGR